jgi:hypothetical protein
MNIKNNKGVMFVTSTFLIAVLAGTSVLFLNRSINEIRAVEREVDRFRAYCAAEAGFQGALSQIGTQSYTGFVNTAEYTDALIHSGVTYATCTATTTADTTDFIIIQSTGTASYSSRTIQARVFLDSNLSKYLVYADTTSFGSGANAQYGEALLDENTGLPQVDGTGRSRVAGDDYDRAMMYFTGDWNITGSNVEMYGNVYVNDDLNVYSGSDGDIHGDTFVGKSYIQSGTLTVNDTWDDGADKRTMTSDMTDVLNSLNLSFYSSHNSIPTFGATAQNRYIKFVESADGTHTVVQEYNDRKYSSMVNSYNLPATAIIYVNGDAYIKGTIKGRISIVASDDIFIQGNLEYANGLAHANASDAAAYIAKDKIFFAANSADVAGIFYASKSYSSDPAFDATYDTNGYSNPGAKVDLKVRGNRVINGTTNLSYYDNRQYIYDPYLKKFRPPGLPVTSVVSFVREV